LEKGDRCGGVGRWGGGFEKEEGRHHSPHLPKKRKNKGRIKWDVTLYGYGCLTSKEKKRGRGGRRKERGGKADNRGGRRMGGAESERIVVSERNRNSSKGGRKGTSTQRPEKEEAQERKGGRSGVFRKEQLNLEHTGRGNNRGRRLSYIVEETEGDSREMVFWKK